MNLVDQALEVDEHSVKALFRRGKCRSLKGATSCADLPGFACATRELRQVTWTAPSSTYSRPIRSSLRSRLPTLDPPTLGLSPWTRKLMLDCSRPTHLCPKLDKEKAEKTGEAALFSSM